MECFFYVSTEGWRDQEWSDWICESHPCFSSGSFVPVGLFLCSAVVWQFSSRNARFSSPQRVRGFISMKSYLCSGGVDFLIGVVPDESNLRSGFVLFLEGFLKEVLAKRFL